MILWWRLDKVLQHREVTQEELAENFTVSLRQNRTVGPSTLQSKHALHVPKRLEQVEHVGAVLVKKLAHK